MQLEVTYLAAPIPDEDPSVHRGDRTVHKWLPLCSRQALAGLAGGMLLFPLVLLSPSQLDQWVTKCELDS